MFGLRWIIAELGCSVAYFASRTTTLSRTVEGCLLLLVGEGKEMDPSPAPVGASAEVMNPNDIPPTLQCDRCGRFEGVERLVWDDHYGAVCRKCVGEVEKPTCRKREKRVKETRR